VSVLIPAFNAQAFIADTIKSALAQTWRRKEIIVVDDGSTDQTPAIVQQFASKEVTIITQENQGAAGARNKAFSHCHGDYIQWLDADDLLSPDKIARQMEALDSCRSKRTLLSSGWGGFMYRAERAHFSPTALWCDLPPVEWLLRKLAQNLYMQTATWLVSRELTEAAGPWDVRLVRDNDGEYFCRVLLACDGVRFIPEAKVYYRMTDGSRVSYVGRSNKKRESLFLSIRLHISYLRSLEESQRVRAACVQYLENWLIHFYPDRLDIVKQMEELATGLNGHLETPRLPWKYAWIKNLFGWGFASRAYLCFPKIKWGFLRAYDKVLFRLHERHKWTPGRRTRKESGPGVSDRPLLVHRGRLAVNKPHSASPDGNAAKADNGAAGGSVVTRLSLPVGASSSLGCSEGMKPLVSILIPAFNAQEWVADAIRSAVHQTWPRKEIIVVDDGSTDQTLAVARHFASGEVSVVTQANQGAAAARNKAFSLCQGDFIQWLDADDLLSPDKISQQMARADEAREKKVLLSSGWAYFDYRPQRARFSPTPLWRDLSPVEWLLRKMGQNLHMQTATWLVSRELTEAAGPWDTRLLVDDDGEYFCRVLLASSGTRFVPEARVYYRVTGGGRLSYIGWSERKQEAQLLSMKLHIQYLRSLEDSERVRRACVDYLQTWLPEFYLEGSELVKQAQQLAEALGGQLKPPRLSWKYTWIQKSLGWTAARQAQLRYNRIKSDILRAWDKAMFRLESRHFVPRGLKAARTCK
jgi:glycosyltransferase involved in cell wall biosynthesis